MKPQKDSTEVIEFMTLFAKLRNWIDDDPNDLEKLATDDEVLKRLCNDLGFAAILFSMNEKRQRRLFSESTDPKFIAAWRTYEENYASTIAGIFLSDIGFDSDSLPDENRSPADRIWETADEDGKNQAEAIEGALSFAKEQATESFRENIEEGTSAWNRLVTEIGFDLRGIFRRRELVPFVYIPRHVSQRHGSREKLSLLTHLQEAHDAFVFGAHFAALALMRSILETTLKMHYRAIGKDLKDMINNCHGLPDGASKLDLHRLRRFANIILHVDKEKAANLPNNFERMLLHLLSVLRALIEGVPSRHP